MCLIRGEISCRTASISERSASYSLIFRARKTRVSRTGSSRDFPAKAAALETLHPRAACRDGCSCGAFRSGSRLPGKLGGRRGVAISAARQARRFHLLWPRRGPFSHRHRTALFCRRSHRSHLLRADRDPVLAPMISISTHTRRSASILWAVAIKSAIGPLMTSTASPDLNSSIGSNWPSRSQRCISWRTRSSGTGAGSLPRLTIRVMPWVELTLRQPSFSISKATNK